MELHIGLMRLLGRFWRLCLGVDNMHSFLQQTWKVLLGLVWLLWWLKVFEFRV